MILKNLMDFWNMFLDEVCEHKEVMVNSVHLEFIAVVDDVPTE